MDRSEEYLQDKVRATAFDYHRAQIELKEAKKVMEEAEENLNQYYFELNTKYMNTLKENNNE